VVVGSGPAGATAAWELAKAGVEVIILEAGPRPPEDRFEVMDRSKDGSIPWPRASYPYETYVDDIDIDRLTVRMVGGTSLTWGATTPRFQPNDFRLRSAYGVGEDWPLTYDELEPYYVRAERLLGVSGANDNPWAPPRSAPFPMPPFPMNDTDLMVQKAAGRLGILFHQVPHARNSVPYDGRSVCLYYATCRACPIGARYGADETIRRLEAKPNVRLLTEAEVTRIELDARGRARLVVYVDAQGNEEAVAADRIILATQSVEAIRILLNSSCPEFPSGLCNRNGQLGLRFMDRPKFYIMGRIAERQRPYRQGFETATTLAFHDHAQRSEFAGARILVRENSGPSPSDIAARSGLWGRELRQEITELFGHYVTLGCYLEPLPYEHNRISTSRSVKGRSGTPGVHVHFKLMHEYETRAYHKMRKVMEDILQELGATDIRVLMPPSNAGHYMGGHRMGKSRDTSTTDSYLETHDVPGLYLATAGAYPTGGVSNPTLTTVALTMRMADRILGRA
jgi:choline dehydrogenase-like flavoprotein